MNVFKNFLCFGILSCFFATLSFGASPLFVCDEDGGSSQIEFLELIPKSDAVKVRVIEDNASEANFIIHRSGLSVLLKSKIKSVPWSLDMSSIRRNEYAAAFNLKATIERDPFTIDKKVYRCTISQEMFDKVNALLTPR